MKFTITEIKNFLELQDNLVDAICNLHEESIYYANDGKIEEKIFEESLHDRIFNRMSILLKKQKEQGKEFLSDEAIDNLIDNILNEEIGNKKI